MPHCTLVYLLLLAASTGALPQSFVLDMGSIHGAVLDPPPPAPQLTTSSAPSWPTAVPTTLITSTTSTATPAPANSTITAAFNSTTRSTCLPTTTIVITLPNPTPRPTSTSERSGEIDTPMDSEDATPFDTAAPGSLSKWPYWFTAATFALVFYDILTLGVFLWLWVFGYLWWFRRGRSRSRERAWRGRGVGEEIEMARLDTGTAGRYGSDGGRYERTSEWVRTGRGNRRVRNEGWERARSAREAELEGEMRRLGMI